jgi:hypothetical protein
MRLKPIEDGMVVCCHSKDMAEKLIKWAYECGYEWDAASSSYTAFYKFDETCYEFKDAEIAIHSRKWYEENNEESRVILFCDLIMPGMTEAEEILDFLIKHYNNGMYPGVFDENYDFYEMIQHFSAKEIIKKIKKYKTKKEREKNE